MTLENFYLVCFVVGFAFTAITFFSGALHIHLPGHGHFHAGGHGGFHGGGQPFPFFSPLSIAVFLAWFGGTRLPPPSPPFFVLSRPGPAPPAPLSGARRRVFVRGHTVFAAVLFPNPPGVLNT